jgi:Patatin-like phospholipase
MNNNGFVDYQKEDADYFGAAKIIEKEHDYIRRRRAADNKEATEARSQTTPKAASKTTAETPTLKNLSGLALSGGGIRSASFSIGVMQALAHNGWLKKIDYLSTVSGGGYAGSSLSWLLSETAAADNTRFGVSQKNFPYGSYPMHGLPSAQRLCTASTQNQPSHVSERYKGKMLRYLRQQAKYLTPGDGITAMSLVAIILRGALLSLSVYFGLLVLSFMLIYPLLNTPFASTGIPLPWQNMNLLLGSAITTTVLFVLSAFVYSLASYFLSKNPVAKTPPLTSYAYRLRQFYERNAARLLTMSIVLALLGLIPETHSALHQWLNNVTEPLSSHDAFPQKTTIIGILSTLLGALSGVFAFFKSSSIKSGRLPMGLVVAIGSAALWFGLLLGAYVLADRLWLKPLNEVIFIWLVSAFLLVLLAFFANINYLSIHRYYRDRLMELFMPDIEKALGGAIATQAVSRADKTPIHTVLGSHHKQGLAENPAPYHLINCNVVLSASNIPKFRGRGGDNFILSPYFCGSNATGWQISEQFMNGGMTLPTAMAISGAAVNPSTGVGGQGISRQPLLSMLMGLLNIRLGYWASNPNPRKAGKQRPNFFQPGLSEMFLRTQLNENSPYLQLTDGGHFENLAFYELIRRRSKLIIVCDAGADPEYQFSDLSNAIEKVRTDFGTLIHCNSADLQTLVPQPTDNEAHRQETGYAQRGYLMSTIIYPDDSQGRLIYLKTNFFKDLSADLYGYKKNHPQFPDEPTSDQFFDEQQFEAYRELGFQSAWQMMSDDNIGNDEIIQACIHSQKISAHSPH